LIIRQANYQNQRVLSRKKRKGAGTLAAQDSPFSTEPKDLADSLLVAVLAQFFLALVGGDFLLFSFATAGHSELLTKDGG